MKITTYESILEKAEARLDVLRKRLKGQKTTDENVDDVIEYFKRARQVGRFWTRIRELKGKPLDGEQKEQDNG